MLWALHSHLPALALTGSLTSFGHSNRTRDVSKNLTRVVRVSSWIFLQTLSYQCQVCWNPRFPHSILQTTSYTTHWKPECEVEKVVNKVNEVVRCFMTCKKNTCFRIFFSQQHMFQMLQMLSFLHWLHLLHWYYLLHLRYLLRFHNLLHYQYLLHWLHLHGLHGLHYFLHLFLSKLKQGFCFSGSFALCHSPPFIFIQLHSFAFFST